MEPSSFLTYREKPSNSQRLKDEIEALQKELRKYGFSFFDLIESASHAEKTRKICMEIVAIYLKNEDLLFDLKSTKKLNINYFEKNMKVPRKKMERHRKYIIAVIEILSGEYPELAEYLHRIRKEIDK